MTDFAETVRQRCRNRNCKKNLPAPTANDHHAFCRAWCHEAFYGSKCLVCEKPLPPDSRSTRKLCKRPKCRYTYSQNRSFFDFPAPGSLSRSELSKTPVKEGFLGGQKRDRASPVAGPQLTALQSRCAAIPDGPNGEWRGGEVERVEARNTALLRAAGVPDLPLTGGCFTDTEWREVISPDGVRCFVAQRDTPVAFQHSDWRPVSPAQPIAGDLSIPEFLQRTANKRAAA